MTNYRVFNTTIACDLALPELPKSGEPGSITVRRTASVDHSRIDWRHDWCDEDEEVELSLGKIGESFVLHFPDLADILITGDLVEYATTPDLPENTLRHLLLDQALPRLFGHSGHLVLHASGVKIKDMGAVLFVGKSGIGKSTLASAFKERGATLVADDCVLVNPLDEPTVTASYSGLRLYPDSFEATQREQGELVNHYSDKRRLTAKGEVNDIPLHAICLLDQAEEIQVTPSRSADDLARLINQCFLLDVTDMKVHERQFTDLKNLLDHDTTILRVNYPHNISQLNALVEGIRSAL